MKYLVKIISFLNLSFSLLLTNSEKNCINVLYYNELKISIFFYNMINIRSFPPKKLKSDTQCKLMFRKQILKPFKNNTCTIENRKNE